MTEPKTACRSTSPDGARCTKPRGHRVNGGAGANENFTHYAPIGKRWDGGINTEARWYVTPGPEHYTEADYETWMRL